MSGVPAAMRCAGRTVRVLVPDPVDHVFGDGTHAVVDRRLPGECDLLDPSHCLEVERHRWDGRAVVKAHVDVGQVELGHDHRHVGHRLAARIGAALRPALLGDRGLGRGLVLTSARRLVPGATLLGGRRHVPRRAGRDVHACARLEAERQAVEPRLGPAGMPDIAVGHAAAHSHLRAVAPGSVGHVADADGLAIRRPGAVSGIPGQRCRPVDPLDGQARVGRVGERLGALLIGGTPGIGGRIRRVGRDLLAQDSPHLRLALAEDLLHHVPGHAIDLLQQPGLHAHHLLGRPVLGLQVVPPVQVGHWEAAAR